VRDGLFLICSFAMLWELEGFQKKPAAGGARGLFSFFGGEALELMCHVVVILFAYFLAVEIWLPIPFEKDWVSAFSLPAAYLGACLRKKSPLFFLTVFAVSSAIMLKEKEFSFLRRLMDAVAFSGGVFLFRLFFSGIRWRLSFSTAPRAIEGIPLAWIVGAAVCMILMGFEGWRIPQYFSF
jgi:hypothetical protein